MARHGFVHDCRARGTRAVLRTEFPPSQQWHFQSSKEVLAHILFTNRQTRVLGLRLLRKTDVRFSPTLPVPYQPLATLHERDRLNPRSPTEQLMHSPDKRFRLWLCRFCELGPQTKHDGVFRIKVRGSPNFQRAAYQKSGTDHQHHRQR